MESYPPGDLLPYTLQWEICPVCGTCRDVRTLTTVPEVLAGDVGRPREEAVGAAAVHRRLRLLCTIIR
jgi:hypothetical protein